MRPFAVAVVSLIGAGCLGTSDHSGDGGVPADLAEVAGSDDLADSSSPDLAPAAAADMGRSYSTDPGTFFGASRCAGPGSREPSRPLSFLGVSASRRRSLRASHSESANALVRDPEIFVGTVTEKLLTYALGRGLAYYDMPTVRAIVRDASPKGYTFSSIVFGIVTSTPFQKRIKLTQAIEHPALRTVAR